LQQRNHSVQSAYQQTEDVTLNHLLDTSFLFISVPSETLKPNLELCEEKHDTAYTKIADIRENGN